MSRLNKKRLRKLRKGFNTLEQIRLEEGSIAFLKCLFYGAKYILYDKGKIVRMKQMPPKLIANRIIFETNDDFTDNGRALYDYMMEHNYQGKYEIIWLVTDPSKYKHHKSRNVKFVRKFVPGFTKRSLKAFYYALTASFIFYTQAFNWVGMARKNQVFFNLWHGCGYKANKGDRKVFFDYVLVPGELFLETKKEFFHCSSRKILPLGYPRYDIMLSGSSVAAAYCKHILNEAESEKLVLWMPTYRHATSERLNEETLNNTYNIPIINNADFLHTLDTFCRERKILLVIKSHYLQIPYDFGEEKMSNILYLTNQDLADNGVQLYEFIHYSDALITDYSSVSIDYLLLDRPIGFTLDDYEDYTNSRGWVFDNPLEYMPGKHIYSGNDLLDFLSDVQENRDLYKEQRASVKKLTHNPCNNYCQRVLDFLKI